MSRKKRDREQGRLPLSVAEVRRVIWALQMSGEQRTRQLWWSLFRCLHQVGAKHCHQKRRARQAHTRQVQALPPIHLFGMSELTDVQWEEICHHVPKYIYQTRRQVSNPRQVVEGILWVMRTGSRLSRGASTLWTLVKCGRAV